MMEYTNSEKYTKEELDTELEVFANMMDNERSYGKIAKYWKSDNYKKYVESSYYRGNLCEIIARNLPRMGSEIDMAVLVTKTDKFTDEERAIIKNGMVEVNPLKKWIPVIILAIAIIVPMWGRYQSSKELQEDLQITKNLEEMFSPSEEQLEINKKVEANKAYNEECIKSYMKEKYGEEFEVTFVYGNVSGTDSVGYRWLSIECRKIDNDEYYSVLAKADEEYRFTEVLWDKVSVEQHKE